MTQNKKIIIKRIRIKTEIKTKGDNYKYFIEE
jgi:hypothetical protein